MAAKVLIAVELLYGVLGLVSGALLIADPSGAGLGFTPDIREKIPFQSFLPVGLFLFTVFGIIPLILAFGAVTRKEYAFESISRTSDHHWSWTGGMLLISALVLWLMVEGMLIGLDFAATYMTVMLGAAIFILLSCRPLLLPSEMRIHAFNIKDRMGHAAIDDLGNHFIPPQFLLPYQGAVA